MTLPPNNYIGCKCVHRVPEVVAFGKVQRPEELRQVVLLAVSGRYAMVKRPKAYPYVCVISEIELVPTPKLTAKER